MNQLIAIGNGCIGESIIKTVNARELHSFLGVKSEYRHWIKNRISNFDFIENQDFTIVGKNLPGTATEYFISLGMAKELSMVERNEKGKQARQYFIECERVAKTPQMTTELSRLQLIEMAMQAEKERIELAHKIDLLAPQAAALEQITAREGMLCISDAAKILGRPVQKFGMELNRKGYVFKRKANGAWVPYEKHVKAGLLIEKLRPVLDELTGDTIMRGQTYVTPKGLGRLAIEFQVGLGLA